MLGKTKRSISLVGLFDCRQDCPAFASAIRLLEPQRKYAGPEDEPQKHETAACASVNGTCQQLKSQHQPGRRLPRLKVPAPPSCIKLPNSTIALTPRTTMYTNCTRNIAISLKCGVCMEYAVPHRLSYRCPNVGTRYAKVSERSSSFLP